MHNYLYVVWDEESPSAPRRADLISNRVTHADVAWTKRWQSPNSVLYDKATSYCRAHRYTLSDGLGAVLGVLFNNARGDTVVDDVLPAETSRRISDSRGSYLVENFWGKYVAFVYTPFQHIHTVIRDVSGGIPCYYLELDGVRVFFSDVSNIELIEDYRPQIDWQFLSAFILASQAQMRRTALNGIFELLAGDAASIQRNSHVKQSCIWSPRKICDGAVFEDYQEASALLQKTTSDCIRSWASIENSVLLSLSGGFDSSVVLGCLARVTSGPHLTCINRYGERASEDERKYARQSAQRANVTMLEHPWDIGERRLDERAFCRARTLKPTLSDITCHFDNELMNGIVSSLGFASVWTGQGGDHLFLETSRAVNLADFLKTHGLLGNALPVVRDAARLMGSSIWHAIRDARQLMLSGSSQFNHADLTRQPLVNIECLPKDVAEFCRHPWMEECDPLPPGKAEQIFYLSEVVNRHRPISGRIRGSEHHPLLSQPIIELCLQIPTYVLLKGGQSRALARDAFRDVIPESITQRTTKGATTSYILGVFRRSQSFVKDLLLDGALATQGILNRPAAEALLCSHYPLRAYEMYPLMSCIAAELFVRSWANNSAALRGVNSIGRIAIQ